MKMRSMLMFFLVATAAGAGALLAVPSPSSTGDAVVEDAADGHPAREYFMAAYDGDKKEESHRILEEETSTRKYRVTGCGETFWSGPSVCDDHDDWEKNGWDVVIDWRDGGSSGQFCAYFGPI